MPKATERTAFFLCARPVSHIPPLAVSVFVVLFATSDAVLLNAGVSLKQDQAQSQSELQKWPVRIVGVPDAPSLADALRAAGYRVEPLKDDEQGQSDLFRVLSIGEDVPVDMAQSVMRIVKREMPRVRHVFMQYENPVLDSKITANAHRSWIDVLGLRQWTDTDFAALSKPGLTRSQFHAAIDALSVPSSLPTDVSQVSGTIAFGKAPKKMEDTCRVVIVEAGELGRNETFTVISSARATGRRSDGVGPCSYLIAVPEDRDVALRFRYQQNRDYSVLPLQLCRVEFNPEHRAVRLKKGEVLKLDVSAALVCGI